MIPYIPPWKKKQWLMGPGRLGYPLPGGEQITSPLDESGLLGNYGNVESGNPMPISPSWTGRPSGIDGGLVAGNARVASGTTIPQTSGSAGGGKWKKVIEQLGKMTGPEPDWSLSPQKMGVPSPWSPTNVAWSAVGSDMFGRKKKESPY